MIKQLWTTLALLMLSLAIVPCVLARGGRGGGGGGGRAMGGMGGGGAARSAGARTPSMSGPSVSRPSMGSARPGGGYASALPGGGARPGAGVGGQVNRPQGNRPALGNLPTPNRPGTGISTRPGGGTPGGSTIASRPGTRPPAGTTRPGVGGGPSQGQLNDFLDLGGVGSRPAISRPATLPGGTGGSIAGNAAQDFLKDRPENLQRPSTRPALPGTDGGRPGIGDIADVNRPGRPGRPGSGDGATTLPAGPDRERPGRPGGGVGDRPGRPDGRPASPGDRPGRPDGGHRPDRLPEYDRWQNWRHENWINVNNNWTNNWNHYGRWFDGDWCHHHPYWHYRPGFNYWGWTTWPVITGWFPWGWTEPVYYNYGSNVYYVDDQVYYGDTVVATAADYAYQAEQIALSVPETPPPDDSWMSLGVFAVMPDNMSAGSEASMFLQLAVSKEGVIAGTLQNTVSGLTTSVEGMVDRETQRAAWTEIDKTRPIMETGIGNLTQDTAAVLVHFADESTQQWLLVRMKQPPEHGANAAASSSSTPPITPPQPKTQPGTTPGSK